MNRRHIWKIAPLGLLVSTLVWFAHAQSISDLQVLTTLDDTLPRRTATSRELDLINISNFAEKKLERKLEQKTRNLVQLYRGTSDAVKREGAKSDLQKVVSEHFGLRQAARQQELAKLEKELERLRALHQKRQDQKERIISDRVGSLLREADGLGWGSSRSGNRSLNRFRGSSRSR